MNNELLWDFADGLLDPTEHAAVEAQLQSDPALRAQLADVERERALLLAAVPLESPRPGFTDGVMAAWVAEQMGEKGRIQHDSGTWRIWTVTLLLGGGVLLSLLTVLTLAFRSVKTTPINLPTPQWQLPTPPSADWWSSLTDSGSLQVAVCLALTVLLLRVADKFWLQRRFA